MGNTSTARATLLAGLVTLGAAFVPGLATAQGPTFIVESAEGSPGATVPVRIFLAEGPTDTAAYNFTLLIENSGLLASNNITGDKAPGLPGGFTYLDNSLTTTAGLEYRAVLYSSGASTVFNSSAASGVHIATVNIPVSASAAPGETINLSFRNEFDTDGRTGLVGVSNAAGGSIVPGSAAPADARPNATAGVIDIVEESGLEFDFRPGPTPLDGWEFAQIIPTVPAPGLDGNQVAGQGMTVEQQANNTFGFWQTIDAVGSIIPSAGPGNILVHHWTFATSAGVPKEIPTIRLRATKADQPYTQTHDYQQPSSSIELLPTAPMGDSDLTAVSWVPPARTGGDPDRDAFILAFDLMSFGGVVGVPGTFIAIKQADVSYLSESALTDEEVVYQHDFSGGDTDEFTPPNEEGVEGFILPVVASSGTGLGVSPTQGVGAVNPDTGTPAISFGWWEKTLQEWVVEAGKVYRIDLTIASTAPSVDLTDVARLRLTVGENDFIATTVVEAGSGDITPNAAGRALSAFVKIPDVLAGNPVKVSFDGYRTNNDASGGVILKSLTVLSFTHPQD